MKKLIGTLLVLALIAPAAGCFKNTIIVDKGYNPSKTTPDLEEGWRMHLIGIVAISDDIMLDKVCAQGAGIIEVETTFLNGLLSNIVPLISFQTARVYCKGGAAASLTLDGNRRIVDAKRIPGKNI